MALITIKPTTVTGVIAVLRHAYDFMAEGNSWLTPDNIAKRVRASPFSSSSPHAILSELVRFRFAPKDQVNIETIVGNWFTAAAIKPS
jgi:hypothetical protein